MGGDRDKINAEISVEVVIDDCVEVDRGGRGEVVELKMELEFKGNEEGYKFFSWL
ncbi:hypothetical protein [Bacillus mycoides]|uniref:hypothetical protein n=1 Tax=Bacillus mycoides TaxID=1405 RepID=UPI0016436288|nr:hypothetical protein [Bacillus mycoides]